MRNKLQLLLATAVLTVLIWIYADQQGYKTADLPVAVRVVTLPEVVPNIEGAPRATPGTLTVTLTARGPNAVLRGINQGRGQAIEVRIPISDNIDGQAARTIDIRDAVTEAARDQGLQFISVNPATISVTFDRLVSHELEVVPDTGAFSQAVSSLDIEPPAVTVSVLQSHLATMGDFEKRLVVPIEQELRSRSRETTFEFTVPLDEPRWQGVPARFTPSAIRFRGRLKQPYEPVEVKLIPLRVLLPWNWPADQYDIVWEDERDRTQSVRLQVPVGKPAGLTNRDVLAFISIDEKLIPPAPPVGGADAPGAAEPSPQSREVRFVFPPGFEDVKVESPPAFVRFHIVRRAQNPAAAPQPAAESAIQR